MKTKRNNSDVISVNSGIAPLKKGVIPFYYKLFFKHKQLIIMKALDISALLNNPLICKISGKLGDVVFRNVRGKTIICKRPVVRPTNNPEVLRRRKRFSFNTKLAKCINDIPECKYLWTKSTHNKMSSYNAIIKANYDHVSDDRIVSTPYLFPQSFNFSFYDFGVKFDYCEILLNYSKEIFDFINDYSKEKFIKVIGVIYCERNINQEIDPFCFKNVSSCNYPVSETGNVEMSILLDTMTLNILKQYSRHTLFFAFVTSDEDLVPLNSVSTFTQEFKSP
ncbi:MAG: hypothetical protein WCG45_02635 [bacterium]